jgi:hypothetical protein
MVILKYLDVVLQFILHGRVSTYVYKGVPSARLGTSKISKSVWTETLGKETKQRKAKLVIVVHVYTYIIPDICQNIENKVYIYKLRKNYKTDEKGTKSKI